MSKGVSNEPECMLHVRISMQTQALEFVFFLFFFWTPRQGRWVMPGRSEPGKDYHCVLGQVSGAGGDDGDAAGAVAGDFWGEGSGSEGTETHQLTERQSPTPADSP